jgi:UrcA family protein
MNRIRFFVPIVVATSLLLPSAASAETVSRNVSFRDLDLSSPAGIATLDQRIATTVGLLCGRPQGYYPPSFREVRRCRSEALASVQSQRDMRIAAAQRQSIELASR